MRDTKNKLIETVGTISKKETLESIESSFSNGALVLENRIPFPGYYHATIPDEEGLNPRSIFLVTKKVHQEEEIMRVNHFIKKEFQKPFDATVGEVLLFNETRPCIRVKNMGDYNNIAELVELYSKQGIHFLKYRIVRPYTALIKIRKYFALESPEPGFYVDVEDKNMCYFQIPVYLKWNDFEKITLDLKRNLDYIKFDAAIGTIYRKNCLIDMIRIYDEHVETDTIMSIKTKFIDAIKSWNAKQ